MKTNPKILIIGSTGKLGSMLLNFCSKNKIRVFAITGFNNQKKLRSQRNKFNIKNAFLLNNKNDNLNFKNFLISKKIDLVYFLDYGCESILYIDLFLKNNFKSYIAIANKEMVIAGGSLLINKIISTNNKLIPLDSEHFSLSNFDLKNNLIKKIFITASGGPFYHKKKINLNKVKIKNVLTHPKWKMGINNTIDSSNFVNKVLEMYELSIIYNINLKKIDFFISSEAYIHSVVINNDNIININCFDNNMLIPLTKPLLHYSPNLSIPIKNHFLSINKMKLEIFKDKRFKITNYLKTLKNLSHSEQIAFMLFNNIAQKKYLASEIKYNDIIVYIMSNLSKLNFNSKFNSFDDTIEFIQQIKNNYDF